VEAYQKVAALNSRHFGALNNLAWIYAQQEKNLNQAFVMVKKAMELQPKNGLVLDTLGYILYRQGKLDDAEGRLKEALHVLPRHASILYHLGLIAHAQGRTDEAMTAIQRALLLNPDFDDAHEARLLLKQLSG
jgi:Tfp pilus assembly protein PilF